VPWGTQHGAAGARRRRVPAGLCYFHAPVPPNLAHLPLSSLLRSSRVPPSLPTPSPAAPPPLPPTPQRPHHLRQRMTWGPARTALHAPGGQGAGGACLAPHCMQDQPPCAAARSNVKPQSSHTRGPPPPPPPPTPAPQFVVPFFGHRIFISSDDTGGGGGGAAGSRAVSVYGSGEVGGRRAAGRGLGRVRRAPAHSTACTWGPGGGLLA
jgi:hypothetical protein